MHQPDSDSSYYQQRAAFLLPLQVMFAAIASQVGVMTDEAEMWPVSRYTRFPGYFVRMQIRNIPCKCNCYFPGMRKQHVTFWIHVTGHTAVEFLLNLFKTFVKVTLVWNRNNLCRDLKAHCILQIRNRQMFMIFISLYPTTVWFKSLSARMRIHGTSDYMKVLRAPRVGAGCMWAGRETRLYACVQCCST
jgi:hypothetical protein